MMRFGACLAAHVIKGLRGALYRKLFTSEGEETVISIAEHNSIRPPVTPRRHYGRCVFESTRGLLCDEEVMVTHRYQIRYMYANRRDANTMPPFKL
jgi:hypothetical protein